MPASFFVDADSDDIIFCLVHRFDDISCRYERNLMLGGLAAKKKRNAEFFLHWAFFETGSRIEDGRSRIENGESIFDPPSLILGCLGKLTTSWRPPPAPAVR